MDIAVENFGALTIATLHRDELDASNVQDFKRDIAPVLAENRHVILDLSHLRFVDSSGLGAMLSYLRQLIALVDAISPVSRREEVTGNGLRGVA
jgi:anti-sigma B factor antagonist